MAEVIGRIECPVCGQLVNVSKLNKIYMHTLKFNGEYYPLCTARGQKVEDESLIIPYKSKGSFPKRAVYKINYWSCGFDPDYKNPRGHMHVLESSAIKCFEKQKRGALK